MNDIDRKYCPLCDPEIRKRHLDNDERQDIRIARLEARIIWVAVAAFIGSIIGNTSSNYLFNIKQYASMIVRWLIG